MIILKKVCVKCEILTDVKKKNSGMESCKECGKEMKKNMIKRHMAKHKREGELGLLSLALC